MKKDFTVQHTNMLKGFAVLLLLFHHLFYKIQYFENCYVFSERWISTLQFSAWHAKVCVSIFLLLSGYGLFKSATKQETVTFRFSFIHIVKVLSMLWVIYILFVPIGFLFGRSMTDIYGTGLRSLWRIFKDLFGITSTANETWWYFREILLFYIMFPLFYYGIRKIPGLTFCITLILVYRFNFLWLLPFVFGMLLAEKDCFSRILSLMDHKRCLVVVCSFLAVFLCLFIRRYLDTYIDAFFGLSIIIFIISILSPAGIIGKILMLLGKHSANIFMFHTFIYSKYFRQEIFWFKYPLLIFLVLTVICLLISMGIELLKKWIGYDRHIHSLTNFFAKYL